jgi:hypothetical protein
MKIANENMAYLEERYYCSLCCGVCFLAGYDNILPCDVAEGVRATFDSKLQAAFSSLMDIFVSLAAGAKVTSQPTLYTVRDAHYMNVEISTEGKYNRAIRLSVHSDVYMFMRKCNLLQEVAKALDLPTRTYSTNLCLSEDGKRAALDILPANEGDNVLLVDLVFRVLANQACDMDKGRWKSAFLDRCPGLLENISPFKAGIGEEEV